MSRMQERNISRSWRVPESVAKRLKLESANTGRPIEQIVRDVLQRHFEDRDAAHDQDIRTFVGAGT